MIPQREIRYYASVSKVFVAFLGSLLFVAIGWWAWTTRHSLRDVFVGVLGLGFGGLCSAIFLYWLVVTVIFRKPVLVFNDAGIQSPTPLQPWRTISVPWAEIASMGIFAQKVSRTSNFYFVVNVRNFDLYGESIPRLGRLASKLVPSLAHTAIAVQLNSMYLFATRQKRADMLERIKTTFMSEIIQHHIDLAMDERPL